MSDEARELLVMVRDGEAECGVLVRVVGSRVARVVADQHATDQVRDVCKMVDRLLIAYCDFNAIAMLAPDSPRTGDVIDQVAQRVSEILEGRDPPAAGTPPTPTEEQP